MVNRRGLDRPYDDIRLVPPAEECTAVCDSDLISGLSLAGTVIPGQGILPGSHPVLRSPANVVIKLGEEFFYARLELLKALLGEQHPVDSHKGGVNALYARELVRYAQDRVK